MAIDGINNYLSTSATAATTTAAQTKKAGTSLDMDDFLKLMVAQLQNQDMNNTADTSQYTRPDGTVFDGSGINGA
jgi:Flagellar hook capping protein.